MTAYAITIAQVNQLLSILTSYPPDYAITVTSNAAGTATSWTVTRVDGSTKTITLAGTFA